MFLQLWMCLVANVLIMVHNNKLQCLYLVFALPVDAKGVLDAMDVPNVVSWATMISGLARIVLVKMVMGLLRGSQHPGT